MTPREIRLAASREVEDESTSLWLLWDEQGTWDRRIRDLLQRTAEHAQALNMSPEDVGAQISVLIALEALTAMREHVRQEPVNRPKREQEKERERQQRESWRLKLVDPRSANKWRG